MADPIFDVFLPTEASTNALAAQLAPLLRLGDTLLLEGEIGAGKSVFCRALIRSICGPETEVPSPTFTLVQVYDAPEFEIWHADLYRLSDPQETIELGLTEAFDTGLCLIEWPDRLSDLRPQEALTLHLSTDDAHHQCQAYGSTSWAQRIGQINV